MNDQHEFDQLLVAYSNRVLTHEEEIRLMGMADDDTEWSATVGEIGQVHELFDHEQRVMARVMAPAEPGEEMDEGYRRLTKAAGRAEEELRSQLLQTPLLGAWHAGGSRTLLSQTMRRKSIWIAAAAALVLAVTLFAVFGKDSAPDMNPNQPGTGTVGPNNRLVGTIFINVEVTRENPEVSWHDVAGARSYEAVIEDTSGNTVLRRAESSKGSTLWKLSQAEYELLKQHKGQLHLRIVAKDGLGLAVATSRDRELRVR